ncbi:hypothetical protein CERZMDRAFT_103356 [Cercospora zeae-maydis SCOH1-5]|uniref:RNase H type-1 domain-containing protein n=1 Tax=Cercospora zeae-maydis SCOH1-5 TaxID=717836 RepID=A0A6A6EZ55_9PEZI|nr:hypothetical protein CERZMDRAFT_103356 [Cercospora zeae-maydis SCOH1-5]
MTSPLVSSFSTPTPPPPCLTLADFVDREKHWKLTADGSVQPNGPGDPAIVGGFGGCAWVMAPLTPGGQRLGECWALPFTRDITSTELTGIAKALDFVVAIVQQLPAAAIADVHITVYSDCKDAVDEVRYAYGPENGQILLSGARDGFIRNSHPTLTHGIVGAIRSLEARGIDARVMWQRLMATEEAIRADAGARKGTEMRRRFPGQHGPRVYHL